MEKILNRDMIQADLIMLKWTIQECTKWKEIVVLLCLQTISHKTLWIDTFLQITMYVKKVEMYTKIWKDMKGGNQILREMIHPDLVILDNRKVIRI